MAKPFQLGRGLSSLIPSKKSAPNYWGVEPQTQPGQTQVGERIEQVEPRLINPNSRQPRQTFDEAALADLVASVKAHGILQPLLVTARSDGRYDLIAGERRLRAAELAQLATVPVVVREAKDQARLELALVENVQRQDLNPLEEALGYKRLHDEFSLTQDEIAQRVGKSRSQVANTLRLLTLPEVMQAALKSGQLTVGHAKVILSLDDPNEQTRLFHEIVSQGLPVHLSELKLQRIRVKSHERKLKIDPQVKDWENVLQSALGTRVKVRQRGGRGLIEIAFFSLEELNQLIRRIAGREL